MRVHICMCAFEILSAANPRVVRYLLTYISAGIPNHII